MCGFAGFLQRTRRIETDALRPVVERMAATLRHRGPDDEGSWVDADAGVALGHRRLSIIDLSVEGHQPMLSASGRYVLVYNGEVYNFQQLRAELDGYAWRGHSDTEVMLAAIERWGVEGSLRRFNGMFAFALWDRSERTLHLARDRLGEKPLYYGWMNGVFLFGSELKALRAHPLWNANIDRASLASFLRNNYVPGPYSIYEGIRKLPPGHRLALTATVNGELPEPQPYWDLRAVAESGADRHAPVDEGAAVSALDALLRDSVRMRMVADVPVGVFLSGGVDSSTVTALAQAESTQPVRSFSIGFEEREYDEAVFAKAVAQHLGTDHTELYVTAQDALEVIPRIPEIYDEPFADSSQIPTTLLSRLAREHVSVTLSGDGGDELFYGYDRYFHTRRIWSKIGILPYPLRKIAAKAATAFSPAAWDRAFAALPFLARSLHAEITGDRLHKAADTVAVPSIDILYRNLLSHWTEHDPVVLGAEEHSSLFMDPRRWSSAEDFRSRMMYCDMAAYLPDDILVKVDRASMSVGLESRVPLLDHRVVEFAWQVPLGLKDRGDGGKWLLRQVLYRYVPKSLIERPKKGFAVPLAQWLRGPLKPWAEALLDERRLRSEGYFDPAPIRRRWTEHVNGSRNWHFWLWDVLMFQAWLEREQGAPSQ